MGFFLNALTVLCVVVFIANLRAAYWIKRDIRWIDTDWNPVVAEWLDQGNWVGNLGDFRRGWVYPMTHRYRTPTELYVEKVGKAVLNGVR